MKNQIKEMLNLQDKINEKVHADWKTQNFEWYRAIWVECAELLDHHGWKWWKKQRPNRDQMLLELIDIWHFGLSSLLVKNSNAEMITACLTKELNIVWIPTIFVMTSRPLFATRWEQRTLM